MTGQGEHLETGGQVRFHFKGPAPGVTKELGG